MWSYYWMAIWSLLYILCNFGWYEYIKICFYLGFLAIILQGIFLWRYICNSTSLCNNCMKSKIQWFHVFKIDGTFELQQQLHHTVHHCWLPETAQICIYVSRCAYLFCWWHSQCWFYLAYSLNKDAHLKSASCIAPYALCSHKWWLELWMMQYKMMHLIYMPKICFCMIKCFIAGAVECEKSHNVT